MSKERPILMSSAMVRAVLDGTKTQTRRAVKNVLPIGSKDPEGYWGPLDCECIMDKDQLPSSIDILGDNPDLCPYGTVGTKLWVRETWATPKSYDAQRPRDCSPVTPIYYAADQSHGKLVRWTDEEAELGRLRPSIFMPRWASRITLEITGVRVERVSEISEEDAIAEGIEIADIRDEWTIHGKTGKKETHYKFYGKVLESLNQQTSNPVWSFQTLWDKINKERGFGWDVNPWCWCLSFRRIPDNPTARNPLTPPSRMT